MTTLQILQKWIATPTETENLEFKEAKEQYDSRKLLEYCVALANEGGGFLVMGVTDKKPRQVVGSKAFATEEARNKIKSWIFEKLNIRVNTIEIQHPDGRVLVFEIPTRPVGQPLAIDGSYLMRIGDKVLPMTVDQLKRIFAEGEPDWLNQPAIQNITADQVIALLDTQSFFDLLNIPYPTTRNGVLERLTIEELITPLNDGWSISNLAAILLAKNLNDFPLLRRKAPRVIFYEGIGKFKTREDQTHYPGYAVGFENLINFIHASAPQNHFIEQAARKEIKMFPRQALRELIANALIHQDFSISGTSVMIEMYLDRIEISNPGTPPIQIDRFIDEYKSRNEKLADLMRRMGICEEKGSGIDKVIDAAEFFQLPAPDFRVSELRTITILFSHQDFPKMERSDRVRACYQHCCLLYVSNRKMSNQTLRERFNLPESKSATVSLVIRDAKERGLIQSDESETASTRYARYLPYWA